jgi:hypothetical protein
VNDGRRELLRHTLATIAYRGGKAIRGAPEGFAMYRVERTSRMPVQVLAHMGDLFDWALSIARGRQTWRAASPLPWDQEVDRFFGTVAALDAYLVSEEPLGCAPEQLMQGPLADALTHIGQLTMLRRLAGSPIRGENYFKADVVTGRVGIEQAPPRVEFD